jgi:hypothetical protein
MRTHARRFKRRKLGRKANPWFSVLREQAEDAGQRRQSLPLAVEDILLWADIHHQKTGNWPTAQSGSIRGARGETWLGVEAALSLGLRGFRGGDTLARLLARHRGKRHARELPELWETKILAWADAHRQRTGEWPMYDSGAIADAPGETWTAVNQALRVGSRGLAGGSSLAQLLAEHRARRMHKPAPQLTKELIVQWADTHRQLTGKWPTAHSGRMVDMPDESWSAMESALRVGLRGLPGGSSLAQLLADERGVRNRRALPRLTIRRILDWADAHFARTGSWPTQYSGRIADSSGETWSGVNTALNRGRRGLRGGSSLADLLARRRGRPNRARLPRLAVKQILTWADAHWRNTGRWPTPKSGPIAGTKGETWQAVESALVNGNRGLPAGSSLARLLREKRGKRPLHRRPRLSEEQVLGWADTHRQRTGRWPTIRSGPIADAAGETWTRVNAALITGCRGFPGGSSLAKLLAKRRGARNPRRPPRLRLTRILAWARAHHRRAGSWPTCKSGPIAEAPGETWSAVDAALRSGTRGLPGGSSLIVLGERCGVRLRKRPPKLTEGQILGWADANHRHAGRWPTSLSGTIDGARGETWSAVNAALCVGRRGLPGGSSLARLLANERGVRNHYQLPRLRVGRILAWADAHRKRTGRWPVAKSGAIVDAPGETWQGVELALRGGWRGLPGGSSLALLLAKRRGKRHRGLLPKLNEKKILAWAKAYFQRTGQWPTLKSGTVKGSGGETWLGINSALVEGLRGLPGGSSLARLLAPHRSRSATSK